MKPNQQPVIYQYSKLSSYLWTAFLIGIVVWSVPHLIKFVKANDVESYMLIMAFDAAFVVMALIVIIKYTIPAWQDRVALELNNEGLVNYLRNFSIPWDDIEDIELRTGKSSSAIYITLKVETNRGSHIRIPLGFVSGKDEDIYEAVKAYKNNR
jgi:hypothetical protein